MCIAGFELDAFASQARLTGDSSLIDLITRLIKLASDLRLSTQLRARNHAIGHCHTQHRRVALHIPAVLQAQRTKCFF